MSALVAGQNRSKYIDLAGRSGTGVPACKDLHTVKLFFTDRSRAEVFIIPSVPVIYADSQFIMEHTAESSVTPVHAVFLTDIFDRRPLGNAWFIIIKSVLQDRHFFRYEFQALFFIYPTPERAAAGNNGSMSNLTVKHNSDPFSVDISFILSDRKFNIDVQPAVRCRSVVFLVCTHPFTVMFFQNFRDLIKVSHGPKPAVQAAEKKHVHFIPLHRFDHPQKFRPLMKVLTGGFRFIYVYPDDYPAAFKSIRL